MVDQTRPLDPETKEALQLIPLPMVPDYSALDVLAGYEFMGDKLALTFSFGFPHRDFAMDFAAQVKDALSGQATEIVVSVDWAAPQVVANRQLEALKGVRNIIAIASGKGGVGKSTTTANVALALAAMGAKVGVLDADIYGPSQTMMLGVHDKRPEMYSANQMKPIPAVGGVEMMSMGNLVTENTPMVWRGPMVSGALQQLLQQTHWHNLDYLLIDMPPGTGDIQLTLSQSVPVSAAIIVTTPQDIALLDARKGIEMFRKVNIPVVGVVENMSLHRCSQCGHEEAIFGAQGGEKLAKEYGVDVLGRLPLDLHIREATDQGCPPVVADPESPIAKKYRDIALFAVANLWSLQQNQHQVPTLDISDD